MVTEAPGDAAIFKLGLNHPPASLNSYKFSVFF